MAKIDTNQKLVDYIMNKLSGGGVIDVEIGEDAVLDVIDDTIQEFSAFAYDGENEKVFVVEYDGVEKDLQLNSSIQAIFAVKGTSTFGALNIAPKDYVLTNSTDLFMQTSNFDISNYTTMLASMSMLESVFGQSISYDFNYNSKILRLLEEPHENKILIHASLEYEPGDIDLIYNHQWVKAMATEQVRLIWASNVGKYSADLVSGASINYSDIRAEAEGKIEQLKIDLEEKWSAPFGIDVL
jgi:hypothetical protein